MTYPVIIEALIESLGA
jgi:hypothetical protein